jgi:hypothetical protein
MSYLPQRKRNISLLIGYLVIWRESLFNLTKNFPTNKFCGPNATLFNSENVTNIYIVTQKTFVWDIQIRFDKSGVGPRAICPQI